MGDKTGIEWTDATWNPVVGCTKVSPGCDHCYAERVTQRFGGDFSVLQLKPDRLEQPLRWRRSRRVFVNSMSDLFHDTVPDDYIANVWAVIALAPRHTFQVLTKRHARMRSLLSNDQFHAAVLRHVDRIGGDPWPTERLPYGLANVWLGVSVETQQWANIRIPALLDTPAAIRFLSCEPLLGPLDLRDCGGVDALVPDWMGGKSGGTGAPHPLIDWVIVGGESGPGARPMHPDWARKIRDDCEYADVPFLFKQWGEWAPYISMLHHGHDTRDGMVRVGKKTAGRELDGRTWDEYPTHPTNPEEDHA